VGAGEQRELGHERRVVRGDAERDHPAVRHADELRRAAELAEGRGDVFDDRVERVRRRRVGLVPEQHEAAFGRQDAREPSRVLLDPPRRRPLRER